MQHLKDSDILAVNCTYLGEALATVIFFRDDKNSFSADDEAMIGAISPIFAISLASIVRDVEPSEDGDTAIHEEDRDDKKPRKDPADWWKTGGDAPY
jgi:hypothetical protein